MKTIDEMKAEKLQAMRDALGNQELDFESQEWKDGDGLEGDSLTEADEEELDKAWEESLEDDDDFEDENYVNPDFPEETPVK